MDRPQGQTDPHDHSGPGGDGGQYLNPASVEVRDSQITDAYQAGVVPTNELLTPNAAGSTAGSVTSSQDDPYWNVVEPAGPLTFVGMETGLEILDTSRSGPPIPVATYTTPISPHVMTVADVSVDGGTLYVAGLGSVGELDITDPTSPSMGRTYTGSTLFTSIEVIRNPYDGNQYAIVGAQDGLYVLSLSTASIEEAAYIDPAPDLDGDIQVNDIATRGTLVYAVTTVGFESGGTLSVFDVGPVANDNPVESDFVEPIQTPDAIALDGQVVYCAGFDTISAFDISTATTPENISSTSLGTLDNFRDIAIRGKFAYLPCGDLSSNLKAFDIGQPSNMSEVWSISLSASPEAVGFSNSRLLTLTVDGSNNTAIETFGSSGAAGGGGGGDGIPLYDTGTVTATGGQQPALDTTITDVSLPFDTPHDLVVYPDSTPGFDAAFNYDWGLQHDDANGETDLRLTVNWDTDPGNNNDVTLRWALVVP